MLSAPPQKFRARQVPRCSLSSIWRLSNQQRQAARPFVGRAQLREVCRLLREALVPFRLAIVHALDRKRRSECARSLAYPWGQGCSIFPSMRITPSRRGRGSTLREKFGYTPTTGFRPRGRGVGASEAERACKGNPVKSTELIAVGQSMTGYRFRFCRFFSRFVLLDFLTRGTLDCGPDEASLSFPLRRPDPPS